MQRFLYIKDIKYKALKIFQIILLIYVGDVISHQNHDIQSTLRKTFFEISCSYVMYLKSTNSNKRLCTYKDIKP